MKCTSGGREWQIAEFIEDHGVGLHQLPGHISRFSLLLFPLQLIDQIDGVKEADAFARMDGSHAQSRRQMRFPGALSDPPGLPFSLPPGMR